MGGEGNRAGGDAGERVAGRLRALGAALAEPDRAPVEEKPCCVYGLVTRTAHDELARQVEELKGRVNTLLWGLGATVVLDVLMRLAGR